MRGLEPYDHRLCNRSPFRNPESTTRRHLLTTAGRTSPALPPQPFPSSHSFSFRRVSGLLLISATQHQNFHHTVFTG